VGIQAKEDLGMKVKWLVVVCEFVIILYLAENGKRFYPVQYIDTVPGKVLYITGVSYANLAIIGNEEYVLNHRDQYLFRQKIPLPILYSLKVCCFKAIAKSKQTSTLALMPGTLPQELKEGLQTYL